MNWKEFLKPDWRKIAFTFVWMVLSILLYWSNVRTGSGPLLIDSYLITFLVIQPILAVAFILNLNIGAITFLILMVLYSYLISCLIVWIYNKFRKKK